MRAPLLAFLAASSAAAFTMQQPVRVADTALNMDRRAAMAGLAGMVVGPAMASAKPASTFFWDDQIETVFEEAQMPTGGKLDLNAAFVVSRSAIGYCGAFCGMNSELIPSLHLI